jgi:DNA-nicking Smr family endonuclease
MTMEQASPAVEKFVRDCREMQMNFVIIVPGIGRNSEDGRAKLRPMVVNKLVDLQNNQRIRNFKTAEPKHGGLGAVYVYLK